MNKACLPPIADDATRLLILGSLPGDASLAAEQYYAHPRNQFWRLVGAVLGIDLGSRAFDARYDALLAAGIGLWDVIGSAERRGSLDTDIRNHAPNPLRDFAAAHPSIRAVAFNGGTAARIGGAQLGGSGLDLVALPSSSPAYTLSFERKAAAWMQLRTLLAQD